jgi:hypothetical protein
LSLTWSRVQPWLSADPPLPPLVSAAQYGPAHATVDPAGRDRGAPEESNVVASESTST